MGEQKPPGTWKNKEPVFLMDGKGDFISNQFHHFPKNDFGVIQLTQSFIIRSVINGTKWGPHLPCSRGSFIDYAVL